MSVANTRVHRTLRGFLALTAGLLLAAGISAQAPPPNKGKDLLDQAKRINEVAVQKIETDVRTALVDAQKLTDPVKAADRLKQGLGLLENDTVLPDARLAALTRMLKDRIKGIETDADKAAQEAVKKDEKKALTAQKSVEDERRAIEQEAIARGLQSVRDLQASGKTAEASRLAAELARRYPGNPAVQGADRIGSTTSSIASAKGVKGDKNAGFAGAMNDVSKSAAPPKGDIEFPKDFATRTAKRGTGIPLTAKEKSILQALNTPLPQINFNNSRFDDVIEYLQTLTGQPIVTDKAALDEAQVTYETPVNLRIKGVTMRTLLRKILNDLGLTYVVKDQVIFVTSVTRAKDMLTTRTYPIADIVQSGMFGNAVLWGPTLSTLQMQQNANDMIALITSTVDPQSWQTNGGFGTISFYAPTRSLVVRQSAEIHAAMGSGGLR